MDTEVLDRPTVPVTARPKTTADILEAAALAIEEFGWVQGNFVRNGGVCALGAINYADHGDPHDRDYENRSAERFLCNAIGSDYVAIWNDAPGRHSWEVTAALRQAAKLARAVTTRSAQDGS